VDNCRWHLTVRRLLAQHLAIDQRTAGTTGEDQCVERVDVPLFGGPLDGREVDVEIDDDGLPPDQLAETSLWFTYGSELLDKNLDGRYEREPVAGSGPPFLYRWIEHRARM
jgi:hypothetical protein